MLNSIQHLIKSKTYEILKQVQDDKTGLFTRLSNIELDSKNNAMACVFAHPEFRKADVRNRLDSWCPSMTYPREQIVKNQLKSGQKSGARGCENLLSFLEESLFRFARNGRAPMEFFIQREKEAVRVNFLSFF